MVLTLCVGFQPLAEVAREEGIEGKDWLQLSTDFQFRRRLHRSNEIVQLAAALAHVEEEFGGF